ncbi:MAG: MiaB/RimO family radical SAM methylthiotransferase [Deltaproteobacteria bacterium]|nr:MiaB/RimO family radical SAM methylthiotransferase [Deltaproteobacteria bacterium]
MKRHKLHIHTVGCKANQADSVIIDSGVQAGLFEKVQNNADADIVVINTCCVTVQAERDSKKVARSILRNNPQAKIIFTGCAVSAFKDFAKDFDNRAVTVGGGKTSPLQVSQWLNSFAENSLNITEVNKYLPYFDIPDNFTDLPAMPPENRTRAFLKIQNGCTHNCTYCIVPKARGKEQSMPLHLILERVGAFKASGVKELVLTGVQLGAYGSDLENLSNFENNNTLANVLQKSAELFYPGRIRLGSIEPWSVNEELVLTVANTKNICNHLHIPLQSGDDKVLGDMKRGYNTKFYKNILEIITSASSEIAVGTDVICGFPTESETAFENSLNFIKSCGFSYLHAFSYSSRPGTMAHKLYGEGDRTTAKTRVIKMREAGDKLHLQFIKTRINKKCTVLVEDDNKGVTETFLQVEINGQKRGTLIDCMLKQDENSGSLTATPL